MTAQTRKKKSVLVVAVALVVVAALGSSYCWWNTNLFGADSFCGGRTGSGEVQAALDSTGRVSQVYAQVDLQRAEFECTVERTSRFVGGDDQQLTVGTDIERGAVLHCGSGDVYFAAKWNVAYDEALHDSTKRDGKAYVGVKKATFQNFLDATAAAHSCPRVTLP